MAFKNPLSHRRRCSTRLGTLGDGSRTTRLCREGSASGRRAYSCVRRRARGRIGVKLRLDEGGTAQREPSQKTGTSFLVRVGEQGLRLREAICYCCTGSARMCGDWYLLFRFFVCFKHGGGSKFAFERESRCGWSLGRGLGEKIGKNGGA